MRNSSNFNDFPKHHRKIIFGKFNAEVKRRIFSNRQFGMIAYIKMAMIMTLQ